jgi:hypothetical protein
MNSRKLLSAAFPALAVLLSFLIAAPALPITPVNKAPSAPNLTLFNISLTGSYVCPSKSLSNSVGPPIRSPKVPASSTSPTKIPSATPPAPAPAAKEAAFSKLVADSSNAFIFLLLVRVLLIPFCIFLPAFPLKFKYFPPRAALTAPLPILKATPPGIAILVISSVILPAVVAAAASSKGLIFANHSSTSAALLCLLQDLLK